MNFEPIQRKLELFESRGWATQSGHRWHFTPEGFLLSSQLILALLDAQEDSPPIVPEKQEARLPHFTPQQPQPETTKRFKGFTRKRPPKA